MWVADASEGVRADNEVASTVAAVLVGDVGEDSHASVSALDEVVFVKGAHSLFDSLGYLVEGLIE